MYISVLIYEWAVLAGCYHTEEREQWVAIFEKVVNKKFPKGVILNIKTCSQMGEVDNYLPDEEFKKILWRSMVETNRAFWEANHINHIEQ